MTTCFVHSVNCTYLSLLALVKFCVCPFPFGMEGGMWDVFVLILDHCHSVYLETSLQCRVWRLCNKLLP